MSVAESNCNVSFLTTPCASVLPLPPSSSSSLFPSLPHSFLFLVRGCACLGVANRVPASSIVCQSGSRLSPAGCSLQRDPARSISAVIRLLSACRGLCPAAARGSWLDRESLVASSSRPEISAASLADVESDSQTLLINSLSCQFNWVCGAAQCQKWPRLRSRISATTSRLPRSEEHTSELQSR